MAVDPAVRAAVIHDLAVGGGADDPTEGAGVVRVDETRGVGQQLILEAGVALRHTDWAGKIVVDAHLVVRAATARGGDAQPVRAAQSTPGALVGHRLTRAGGARHLRAVATARVASDRLDSRGFAIRAGDGVGGAVVLVPLASRVDAVHALPGAGLRSAGGLGHNGPVEAAITRLYLRHVGEKAVIARLHEGGTNIVQRHTMFVHTGKTGEVTVRTAGGWD